MIVRAPGVPPVTKPVREPTDATAVALLVHTPPVMASVSVAFPATHTVPGPVIAPGEKLTVMTAVDEQPDDATNVTVVVPGVTPESKPVVAIIVATEVLLLVQVPVKPGADSEMDEPTQTAVGPPITGALLMIMIALPVMLREQPVVVLVATTV